MKLSKAQQTTLDYAKSKIDIARKLDYPEWLRAEQHIPQHAFQKAVEKGYLKDCWEDYKSGIVLIHCSSKTIWKLAEYGLIEIIEDSNGEQYGIDTIKVLNY